MTRLPFQSITLTHTLSGGAKEQKEFVYIKQEGDVWVPARQIADYMGYGDDTLSSQSAGRLHRRISRSDKCELVCHLYGKNRKTRFLRLSAIEPALESTFKHNRTSDIVKLATGELLEIWLPLLKEALSVQKKEPAPASNPAAPVPSDAKYGTLQQQIDQLKGTVEQLQAFAGRKANQLTTAHAEIARLSRRVEHLERKTGHHLYPPKDPVDEFIELLKTRAEQYEVQKPAAWTSIITLYVIRTGTDLSAGDGVVRNLRKDVRHLKPLRAILDEAFPPEDPITATHSSSNGVHHDQPRA